MINEKYANVTTRFYARDVRLVEAALSGKTQYLYQNQLHTVKNAEDIKNPIYGVIPMALSPPIIR